MQYDHDLNPTNSTPVVAPPELPRRGRRDWRRVGTVTAVAAVTGCMAVSGTAVALASLGGDSGRSSNRTAATAEKPEPFSGAHVPAPAEGYRTTRVGPQPDGPRPADWKAMDACMAERGSTELAEGTVLTPEMQEQERRSFNACEHLLPGPDGKPLSDAERASQQDYDTCMQDQGITDAGPPPMEEFNTPKGQAHIREVRAALDVCAPDRFEHAAPAAAS